MNRSCDTVFNNRNNEIKHRIKKLAAVLLILVLIVWTGALRPACYAAKKTTKTKKTEQTAAKKTKKAVKKKAAKKAGKMKKVRKKTDTSKKKPSKAAAKKKTAAEKKKKNSKAEPSETTKKKTETDKAKKNKTGGSSGTANQTASGDAAKKAPAKNTANPAGKADADDATKKAGQTDVNDGSKSADKTDTENAAKTAGQTDANNASNKAGQADTDDASQKTDSDQDTKTGTDQNPVPSGDPDADAEPVLHAKGAEVYCENTGEVVFSKNASTKAKPYNTATLMTALLAIQKLSPDKKITISKKAAEQPGGSAELQPGEVVTVEQLLYAMLLDSADDAAYALAENYSGSVKSFVRRMNKTAKNIGCKHTHFSDPAGSSQEGNYTTASDFMMIARVALSNSTIKKIASAREYTVPKTNKHESRTITALSTFTAEKNFGIETEITGIEGDQCSIAAGYLESGLQLYIVLLDDTNADRSEDLKAVIDYTKEHIRGEKVISAGKNVGKIRIGHGAKTKANVYTLETGYAYIPKEGSKKLIKTRPRFDNDIKAPVTRYQVVGSYQIYVGNDLVNSVPLVIHEDIPEGWFPSYLGISNNAAIVICAVVLVVIIAGLLIASAREKARRRKRMAKARRIWQLAEQQLREEQERKERGWYF